jgi:hypothetical protein
MKRWMICGSMVLTLAAVGCSRNDARTDAGIAAEVRHDLAEKNVPGVIEVVFVDGTATLSGTVPDAAAKTQAGKIADDVTGVDHVVNNLRTTTAADAPIRPGMGQPVPGAQIPPRSGSEVYPNEVAPNAPPPVR